MTRAAGRLSGETVVVTGGASGIGRAVALTALAEGASVAVLDVDGGSVRDLCGRVRSERLTGMVTDVTDERAVAAAVAATADRLGPPSVLVNNAGRNAYGDPVRMRAQEWDDVFALDLKAAWVCAKHVLPAMLGAGAGSIVNISSVHAHLTAEGMFPYAAAKAGLVGLTRSLALEVGPSGVRVNSVSPGYVRTRLTAEALARSAEGLEAVEAKHALRRIGQPEEIARVVCFLASREASFVTGADWVVDGGISARFA